MTPQEQADRILARANVPDQHALYADLQRMPEIFASVSRAIEDAQDYREIVELARWCEAQAIRFQRLGSKALQKECA